MIKQLSLATIIGLCGVLVFWRGGREVSSGSASDNAPLIQVTSEPNGGLATTTASPAAPSIHEESASKLGQRRIAGESLSASIPAERLAVSLKVEELARSPKLLLEPGVLREFKDLLTSSVAPDAIQSKSEGERVNYIAEVILAINQHVRTLDLEVARLEAVALEELEQAEIEKKSNLEVAIRNKYASEKILAENVRLLA